MCGCRRPHLLRVLSLMWSMSGSETASQNIETDIATPAQKGFMPSALV